METPKKKSPAYSPEVRERAVRMVFEHRAEHGSQWAAIVSIAGKIGATPETLRRWIRQGERDSGLREGLSTTEQQKPPLVHSTFHRGTVSVCAQRTSEQPHCLGAEVHVCAPPFARGRLRLRPYLPAS